LQAFKGLLGRATRFSTPSGPAYSLAVPYFEKGLLTENPHEAIVGDFGAQLTKAARAQLAQIAPNINVQIPQ